MVPGENILQFEFNCDMETVRDSLLNEAIAARFPRIGNDMPRSASEMPRYIGAGFISMPRRDMHTIVRIYDTDGTVTARTNEINALTEQRDRFRHAPRTNFVSDAYACWRIRRISQKIVAQQVRMVQYYLDYLSTAQNGSRNVAIKTPEGKFRLAGMIEYYKLARAVASMKAFRLFVFVPNELLADTNTEVVRVV